MAIVRTDVSEERVASIFRVDEISEPGAKLAATSKRNMRYLLSKRRFLQESHGVTSQKTEFFIVTAVKP
jgi:hypothetical protein